MLNLYLAAGQRWAQYVEGQEKCQSPSNIFRQPLASRARCLEYVVGHLKELDSRLNRWVGHSRIKGCRTSRRSHVGGVKNVDVVFKNAAG